MALFDQPRAKKQSAFKTTLWFDKTPGTHLVRPVDIDNAQHIEQHSINKTGVKCLGVETCPVCQTNRQIYAEHPKDGNKQPGYIAKSERFFMNLLDKTDVKICPNKECGHAIKAENDQFPTACPKCNTLIVTVLPQPYNKVVVFSFGVKVFDQLYRLGHNTGKPVLGESGGVVYQPDGTPVMEYPGLGMFDIELITAGSGVESTMIAKAAKPVVFNVQEVRAEDLFDLTKAYHELTPEEMTAFRKGTQLRDIYAARKTSEPVVASKNESGLAEMKKNLERMYSDAE